MGRIATLPFIRVQTEQKLIYINLFTHDMLGNPPFLEFLCSREKKLLCIAPQLNMKKGCYAVTANHISRKNEIHIQQKRFFDEMMEKLGWPENTAFKVYGEYIPNYRMVGFKTDDLIVLKTAGTVSGVCVNA